MNDAQIIAILGRAQSGQLSTPAAVAELVALGLNEQDAAEMVAIATGESEGDVVE